MGRGCTAGVFSTLDLRPPGLMRTPDLWGSLSKRLVGKSRKQKWQMWKQAPSPWTAKVAGLCCTTEPGALAPVLNACLSLWHKECMFCARGEPPP